jgi:hypothetical protein
MRHFVFTRAAPPRPHQSRPPPPPPRPARAPAGRTPPVGVRPPDRSQGGVGARNHEPSNTTIGWRRASSRAGRRRASRVLLLARSPEVLAGHLVDSRFEHFQPRRVPNVRLPGRGFHLSESLPRGRPATPCLRASSLIERPSARASRRIRANNFTQNSIRNLQLEQRKHVAKTVKVGPAYAAHDTPKHPK